MGAAFCASIQNRYKPLSEQGEPEHRAGQADYNCKDTSSTHEMKDEAQQTARTWRKARQEVLHQLIVVILSCMTKMRFLTVMHIFGSMRRMGNPREMTEGLNSMFQAHRIRDIKNATQCMRPLTQHVKHKAVAHLRNMSVARSFQSHGDCSCTSVDETADRS